MRRIAFLLLLLVKFTGFGLAQQEDQIGIFMLNRPFYNPAFAGLGQSAEFNLHYRKQWSSFTQNPDLFNISAEMPLYMISGAASLQFNQAKNGALNHQKTSLSYNQVKEFSNFGLVSVGIRLHYNRIILDGAQLTTPDGEYEDNLINHKDGVIPNNKDDVGFMGASIGLAVVSNYGDIGISINNIPFQKKVVSKQGFFSYTGSPSINIFMEKQFGMIYDINISPSILVKFENKIIQTDIAAKISYQDNMLVLASLRGYGKNSFDGLNIGLGYKLNTKLWLVYMHEIGISQLRSSHSGSHEILVKYNLNKKIGAVVRTPPVYNLRYF